MCFKVNKTGKEISKQNIKKKGKNKKEEKAYSFSVFCLFLFFYHQLSTTSKIFLLIDNTDPAKNHWFQTLHSNDVFPKKTI